MIQRFQTIWLLLAGVCAFLTVRLSFFSGNFQEAGSIVPPAFRFVNAGFNMVVLIVTILIACIAVVDIFLYKNRKLQGRIALLGILLALLNIYLYYRQTQRFIAGQGNYDITAIFTLLIPIFFFLAYRGIAKDSKLVRSLDRLR